MTKAHFIGCCIVLFGCERFDPAPSAELEGERGGLIAAAAANPLVVRFSEPIVPRSLRLAIVLDLRDGEGNLLDEQLPPRLDEYLQTRLFVFERGQPGDQRAAYALFEERRLQITPLAGNELPLSPLMLVVEPGLEDHEGNATDVRIKLAFRVAEPSGDAAIE
jgi:hypothetical protein